MLDLAVIDSQGAELGASTDDCTANREKLAALLVRNR